MLSTSNKPPAPLAIISQDDLNLGQIASIAMNPSGRKVYLGRIYSWDADRLNLLAISLDANGLRVGEPTLHPDSNLPLVLGARSSITRLMVNPAGTKLYLAYNQDGVTSNDQRVLTVYDLDVHGEPQPGPRTYASGNPYAWLSAMALHPSLPVIYLGGWGQAGVSVYQLDADGEPQGLVQTFSIGSQGKSEIAVSDDGKRLYLGTYPNSLEIVDLDSPGLPIVTTLRSFDAGSEPGSQGQQYLEFYYSSQALYRHPPQATTTPSWPVVVWPLQASGDPTGMPQQFAALAGQGTAVDPARNRAWFTTIDTFNDAFTDVAVTDGILPAAVTLDPISGLPTGTAQAFAPPKYSQQGILTAVAASGNVAVLTQSMSEGIVGNQVKDYWLRVTISRADLPAGPVATPFPAWFVFQPGTFVPLHDVGQLGQPLAAVPLDSYLKGVDGQVVFWIYAYNISTSLLANLTVTVDFFQGDPSHGGRPLKSLTDSVQGNCVALLVPGYEFELPGKRLAGIELMSGHAAGYLATAKAIGIAASERPSRFLVACYQLLGSQGHRGQLASEAEAVALLGINTVTAYEWTGLAPADVNTALDAQGLNRRILGVYKPPSYFDFDQSVMNPADLAAWAAYQVSLLAGMNGGDLASLALFQLADEPGWYYPGLLDQVSNNPDWLTAFRAYLASQGQPSTGVFPIGAAGATDLTSRQQFYWTMRFFTESASRGCALATQAIVKAAGHPLPVYVNFNNSVGAWYVASPNQQYAYNPDAGPNAAMGLCDWLFSGRLSAHTLWTEDGFPDQISQYWSSSADALRSASMLGNQGFGGHVKGLSLGDHPAGASFKILSLIGHGAKYVDIYSFGPEMLFPGNCWSEASEVYKPIADALRLVGRGERLLYPGQPQRGKVALMVVGSSMLWDENPATKMYQRESVYLHFALTHAGYTMDFIDETDIVGGQLTARGYATLYLTGPNVGAAAQATIGDWVNAGGVLAVVLGAGVADEYNTDTTVLNSVLGLGPRSAVRDVEDPSLTPGGTMMPDNPAFGTGPMALFTPVAALPTIGASVAATFDAGGAAITVNTVGRGQAIAYGFFPGRQYWQTQNSVDVHRLPLGWSAAKRKLAVAPAVLAKTTSPVKVSVEMVEACRLDSAQGIAVVLLNWKDEPFSAVTVTVVGAARYQRAASVQVGSIIPTVSGNDLVISLPLHHVDILLIE